MALARVNVSSGGGKKTPQLVSVPVQSGTLTYSGSAQSPTWSGYDATQLTTSGTTSATNAGTYTATFTLKSGYTWADNTVSPKSVSWTIGKATVSVPTVTNTSFTYNGSPHAPTVGTYDSSLITATNTAQTNAGTYSVIFALRNTTNSQWSDGTTANKTVSWTIGKAERILSVGLDKVVLPPGQTTTLAITGTGDSATTATSSNTSVAIASLDENLNLVIEFVGEGTATLTVSQAATDNYNAASMALPVKCKNPVAITDSWATISTRSKNGTAANYYDVGDYKEITLNGNIGDYLTLENEKLRVFILHFNYPMNGVAENNIIWGGFKTADGVDVALCDAKYGTAITDATIGFSPNHNYYNYGGWKGCDLRYDILGATSTPPSEYLQSRTESNVGYNATAATLTSPKADTLLAALPSDFRNALRLWSRWINAKGATNDKDAIEETIDAVTLLTEFEVQGARKYANYYEHNHQTQMDYYRLGNSKVKYKHSDTLTTAVMWWVASAYIHLATYFCGVHTDGSANYLGARGSYGLAPAFKT